MSSPVPDQASAARKGDRAPAAGAGLLLLAIVAAGLLVRYLAPAQRREPPPPGAKTLPRASYREAARWPLPLRQARGLAVGGRGRVYVVGDEELLRLSPAGEVEARAQLGAPARCVSVDAKATVYVGLTRRVVVLDPDLRVIARWRSLGRESLLTSVSGGGGRVYVADAGQRRVWCLDTNGRVLRRLDGRASGGPGFVVPSPYFDVRAAPGGVWVANPGRHRLEFYGEAGELRFTSGRAGAGLKDFCGCCNPSHFALLPDGDLVTSEKGIARVKVISPTGELRALVAGPAAFRPPARGLDLDADAAGVIYLLDPAARAVRVFRKHPPDA